MKPSLNPHILRCCGVMALGAALALPPVLLTLPGADYHAGALRRNLTHHLSARHRLSVTPQQIILPGGDRPSHSMAPREAYFLGRRGDGPRDVYFSHFILGEQGIPVHASPAFSLSKTEAADENQLLFDGRRYLAYTTAIKGKVQVVTLLDLEGLSASVLAEFSPLQRLLQRLTNWQDTGRFSGVGRVEVRLAAAQKVKLSWVDGNLRIAGGRGRWSALVDPARARTVSGPVRTARVQVGRRSLLAWTVDTVRGFSFVGPQRIAWLEEQVYGLVDSARRMSGATITASQIRDEMDLPVVSHAPVDKIEGWPPPPLKPMLRKRLPQEGKWVEVRGPFVRSQPGLPPLFAMTFIRPDKERLFARVYFLAWDARRLDLRMRAGTRDPRSATGFRGDGLIPRKPEVVRRLVGVFNGGFQSIHGDFGMQVAGKLHVPAKPWGATVARLSDGATGFGTWDGAMTYGKVPAGIDSFRQNLTALVEGGKFNPWKRGSWGGGAGLVSGSGPKAFIIRSGLCWHKSGHVMFVVGNPVDGPTLGRAMTAAGCRYGMELDINRGHVGFEFFNVRGPKEKPPEGADRFRPIKYYSYKGQWPKVPDHTFYMREIIRDSGNPAPRWTGREARDFFYLLERPMLPGADLRPLGGEDNEGRWTAAALPKRAVTFPRTMARTILTPAGGARVHLVALDMRWLAARVCLPDQSGDCLASLDRDADEAERPALAVLPLGEFGDGRSLWGDGTTLAGSAGRGPRLTLSSKRSDGPTLPATVDHTTPVTAGLAVQASTAPATVPSTAPPTQAALCPGAHGTLLYAAALGGDRPTLEAALKRAGCAAEVVHLGRVEPLALRDDGGVTSLFGRALPPTVNTPALVLRRNTARWAVRIFKDVTPQPRRVWTAVQPETTRGTYLRRAKRAAEKLGLPPLKKLRDLCKPPYDEVKELKKFRWKDPVTGAKLCDKRKKRKKRKRQP